MMVVGNRCIRGGGNGVVVGRVMSEGQWEFVFVNEGIHDGGIGRGMGERGMFFFFFLLSSLALLLCVFGRSFFSGVSAIEVGDKFWGMFQMLHGFPGAITCGKTFPLN